MMLVSEDCMRDVCAIICYYKYFSCTHFLSLSYNYTTTVYSSLVYIFLLFYSITCVQ